MTRPFQKSWLLYKVALGCLMLGWPAGAAAQSITLDRFSPGEIGQDDFHLSRPLDQGHLRFGVQLHGSYAKNPLVIQEEWSTGLTRRTDIVRHQVNGYLNLSFGLLDRLVLYAALPVVAHMDGPTRLPGTMRFTLPEQPDDAGLGNAALGARVRLLGDPEDVAALAFQTRVSAPTAGKNQQLRGEYRWVVSPEFLFELRAGLLRIVTNLGARIHRQTRTPTITQLTALTYGLGLGLTVFQNPDHPDTRFDLIAQAYGSTEFSNFLDEPQSPLELLGGFKYFHESGIILGAAGGPGLTASVGSPDYRAVATLGWEMPDVPERRDTDLDGWMDDEDDCIAQPEDMDGFQDTDGCPDPDDDRDGIEDSADGCRMEPEDMDGFEDEDGCPDMDNDRDGLLDRADQCPDEPEDDDGFQDVDGCPDLDNDNDTVADTQDKCPATAGPEDNEGCPYPDRDNDGVLDRLDNCPDEPGDAANQGCAKKQQVTIAQDRLEITDVVYFQSGKAVIEPRSFALLRNVAQVINNHPEIPGILIEGHSDSRGRREFNIKLSRERAEAVKSFLTTSGGVDPGRLGAVGYGPDRPLVPDARTAEDHARNRRVEFSFTTDVAPPAP